MKAVPGLSTAKIRCSQEGLAVRWLSRAHSCPAASLSHRFGKTPSPARSPTDALIDLVVRCRLRRQVPICWFDLRPVIRLRIAVTPQRWPARRGYVWRLRVDPDAIKDLPDLRALGNERDQAHLPSAQRAQQREHFVNTGDQHRPQLMRLRPFGCRRFGLGWDRMAQQNHPRRALAHVGWLGLHGDLLGRLCRCSQRHRRSPERRIRGQHTKVAMAVRARRWHQGSNAIDQLQWREVQFVSLGNCGKALCHNVFPSIYRLQLRFLG